MKPENQWLLLLLIGNSILFSVAYFALAPYFPVYIVYLALGVVMTLIYVIYNRGFIGKNLKLEQLPDTMLQEEKQKFIDDCTARAHRSRWMITVIFPIVLAFALDMMYLFLLPMVEGMFQ